MGKGGMMLGIAVTGLRWPSPRLYLVFEEADLM